MFFRTDSTGPTFFSRGRSTRYSDRLHHFSVTIPRCCKDTYANSFSPRTARLWNSLPECFPLTYDVSLELPDTYVSFNLFVLLFLVTPCLVVAVQPCMEWIPIKNCCFYTSKLRQLSKQFKEIGIIKAIFFQIYILFII